MVNALIEMGASPTMCDPSVGPLSPLCFAIFCIFDHKNLSLIKTLFEAERASKDKNDLLSQEVDPMSQAPRLAWPGLPIAFLCCGSLTSLVKLANLVKTLLE